MTDVPNARAKFVRALLQSRKPTIGLAVLIVIVACAVFSGPLSPFAPDLHRASPAGCCRPSRAQRTGLCTCWEPTSWDGTS